MSGEPIIEVRQLVKNFGTFQAVRNVSFTVNRGDVYGFLGPNGAGKSTTMRCMLSLIRPNSGEIRIFGKSLERNRAEILTNIGCIIEKPDFYKYLSAEKNLEIFARISGKDITKKDIHGILEFVGLSDRAKHHVKGFSHGMKQRLGIAQALLHQPDLIVLDEPTTGLDPQGIIEIRNLILRLRDEQKKTVILSSHQLSEMELIANRMVIISKGETIIEGSVADLLNSEELIVRVETTDIEKSIHVLKDFFGENVTMDANSACIELFLKKHEIPNITKLLVDHGIGVLALEPKRKLEDYFIKTIHS